MSRREALGQRRALAREVSHLRLALGELYKFVVDELDPDPHPISAYLSDGPHQETAEFAARVYRRLLAERESERAL